MEWEDIEPGRLERAKVPGGWLVRAFEDVSHETNNGLQSGWDWRVAICFVPDPAYIWELKK